MRLSRFVCVYGWFSLTLFLSLVRLRGTPEEVESKRKNNNNNYKHCSERSCSTKGKAERRALLTSLFSGCCTILAPTRFCIQQMQNMFLTHSEREHTLHSHRTHTLALRLPLYRTTKVERNSRRPVNDQYKCANLA